MYLLPCILSSPVSLKEWGKGALKTENTMKNNTGQVLTVMTYTGEMKFEIFRILNRRTVVNLELS